MTLTENQKKYVPVLIAALISAITLIGYLLLDEPYNTPTPIPSAAPSGTASPTPSQTPTPSALPSPIASVAPSPLPLPSPSASVSPKPSPTPSPSIGVTQVLNSFERPEFSTESQWKQSLTRTLLTGQTTSVVLRSSKPCDFVGKGDFYALLPYTTTKPSAPSYPLGTFYDAMKPLDASNCATAKYLQLDVRSSVVLGDASVTIVNKGVAPTVPYIALVSDFNNWDMVRNYCGGGYCNVESKALQALQIAKDHRISPYKGVPADTLQFWKDYVLAFSQGPVYMGWSSASAWMPTAPVTANAYAYIIDEPAIGTDFDAVVNSWKPYPWIKPMMTAPLRQRDYRVGSPTYAKLSNWSATVQSDVKVFAPVMEQFCQETWKGSGEWYACKADYDAAGKEVWLYTSNMAHGNEGGAATGSPDMVLDRSAVEQFGFFAVALKYDIRTLLYYNLIQGWAEPTTRDLWKDAYQFGGQGDGLLLMPDTTLVLQSNGTYKIVSGQRAFPTMRLKELREASQFIDRLVNAGLVSSAKALVTNTLTWDHSLAKFEALDAQAALLLK